MEEPQYSDFSIAWTVNTPIRPGALLKGQLYLTFWKRQNYKSRGRENRAVVSKSWKWGRQLTAKGRRELGGRDGRFYIFTIVAVT